MRPGSSNEAFVFFDSYGKYSYDIVNRLNKLDNVCEVLATEGAFDLIARIYAENEERLDSAIDKLDNIATVKTILKLKESGLGNLKPKKMVADEFSQNQKIPISAYMECDSCGIPLAQCHCRCPYCGERDKCECALFDAATGG